MSTGRKRALFRLDGIQPIGWPRPRFNVERASGNPADKRPHNDPTALRWRADVVHAIELCGTIKEPFSRGVGLVIVGVFQSPQRNLIERPLLRVGAPDFDNIEEGFANALTKAGVWIDDRIVVQNLTEKWRAGAADPMPRTVLLVEQAPIDYVDALRAARTAARVPLDGVEVSKASSPRGPQKPKTSAQARWSDTRITPESLTEVVFTQGVWSVERGIKGEREIFWLCRRGIRLHPQPYETHRAAQAAAIEAAGRFGD